MGKFRMTRNEIQFYNNVRYAGHCDLQCLLRNHSPIAYNNGIYGWNYDVYEVYGVTILTGYRNMSGKKLRSVSEYEEKARTILRTHKNYRGDWLEQQKIEIENLLKEFCKLNGGTVENDNLFTNINK